MNKPMDCFRVLEMKKNVIAIYIKLEKQLTAKKESRKFRREK
jgi:hypothetical protein